MPFEDFAAGIIVFRITSNSDRHYLIIQNAAGHWEFSKGHPDPGETWIQTAIRELREETGISAISQIPGFSRQIRYIYRDRKMGVVHKVVRFALGETPSDDITLSAEHTDFAFLNLADSLARLTHASARCLLRDADTFLAQQSLPKSRDC